MTKGVGSESKKGRVTRDGIYERPLSVAAADTMSGLYFWIADDVEIVSMTAFNSTSKSTVQGEGLPKFAVTFGQVRCVLFFIARSSGFARLK